MTHDGFALIYRVDGGGQENDCSDVEMQPMLGAKQTNPRQTWNKRGHIIIQAESNNTKLRNITQSLFFTLRTASDFLLPVIPFCQWERTRSRKASQGRGCINTTDPLSLLLTSNQLSLSSSGRSPHPLRKRTRPPNSRTSTRCVTFHPKQGTPIRSSRSHDQSRPTAPTHLTLWKLRHAITIR